MEVNELKFSAKCVNEDVDIVDMLILSFENVKNST